MSYYEDIKAYIDNELTPDRAKEVAEAIDRDPELREEYLFMKQLSGDLQQSAREPQVTGAEATAKRIGKTRKPSLWLRNGIFAISGIGVVCLLGALLPSVMPNQQEATTFSSKTKSANPATALAEDKSANTYGREPAASETRNRVKGGFYAKPESEKKSLADASAPNRYVTPPPTVREGNRRVIRAADMSVKVKDVRDAVAEASTQVMAMGGIVENSNYNASDEKSGATVSFQIPEKNFNTILDTLRKMGKVTKDNINSQDVTNEIADGDGRINALADEESNLISELQRTRDSYTRLEIRQRLSSVRQQIASIKEQNSVTRDLAAMSRVTVQFEKAGALDGGEGDDWFNQTTSGAGNVLGFFGKIFGTGLIYVAFLAPIWLPIVGVVYWLKKRQAS